ncbi:hypothetical protein ACFLW4_04025, partial [Chloroflexota bacterium]
TVPGILTFDPRPLVEQQVTGHLTGSESHIAVVTLRILFSAVLVVLAVAGAILLLARRKFRAAIPVGAIALAPLLLLPISGYIYQAHFTLRLYFFLLPPMVYFAINLLDIRRKAAITILCFILVAAAPLNIVAQYGNQASDYHSPSYIAGFDFSDSAKKSVPLSSASLSQLSLEDDRLFFTPPDQWDPFPTGNHYFTISKRADAHYSFIYGKPEFVDRVWTWLSSSPYYDCIYANPEFNLYIHYGKRPPQGISIAQAKSPP